MKRTRASIIKEYKELIIEKYPDYDFDISKIKILKYQTVDKKTVPHFFIYNNKKYIEKSWFLEQPKDTERKAIVTLYNLDVNHIKSRKEYWDKLVQRRYDFIESNEINDYVMFPKLIDNLDDFFVVEYFSDYKTIGRKQFLANNMIQKKVLEAMQVIEKKNLDLCPDPEFGNWVFSKKLNDVKYVDVTGFLLMKPQFYLWKDIEPAEYYLLREKSKVNRDFGNGKVFTDHIISKTLVKDSLNDIFGI